MKNINELLIIFLLCLECFLTSCGKYTQMPLIEASQKSNIQSIVNQVSQDQVSQTLKQFSGIRTAWNIFSAIESHQAYLRQQQEIANKTLILFPTSNTGTLLWPSQNMGMFLWVTANQGVEFFQSPDGSVSFQLVSGNVFSLSPTFNQSSDFMLVTGNKWVTWVSPNTLIMDVVYDFYISPDLPTWNLENIIVSQFTKYGCVVTTQNVDDNWWSMNNIIATKIGSDSSLSPLLITAHWDSVSNSFGMDDNASGCTGVLEIARALSQISLKRTIIFILFAFEEDGLLGSQEYTQKYIIPKEQKPYAIINFDMIAYTAETQQAPTLPIFSKLIDFPTKGNFILLFTLNSSRWLGTRFAQAIDTFVPDLPYYLIAADNVFENPFFQSSTRSDHAMFWKQGIPGLFITDTADMRSPYYHTSQDTIDTLDIPFMVKVIKATLATTLLLESL